MTQVLDLKWVQDSTFGVVGASWGQGRSKRGVRSCVLQARPTGIASYFVELSRGSRSCRGPAQRSSDTLLLLDWLIVDTLGE